jgi:hypothetical protein
VRKAQKGNLPDGVTHPGIYAIINERHGFAYIGYTARGIKGRWYTHRSYLLDNKHWARQLQQAWNEWGQEAFRIEVLEIIPQGTNKIVFLEREQYHMRSTAYNLYNVNV